MILFEHKLGDDLKRKCESLVVATEAGQLWIIRSWPAILFRSGLFTTAVAKLLLPA